MRIALWCMLAVGCGSSTPLPGPPEPLDPPPLAEGVRIERITLNQAAPIVLMDEDGADPGARPIIAGRPGLLRVHLARDGRAFGDPVDVALTWTRADGTSEVRTVEQFLPGDVDPNELDDTPYFELDAEDVADGVRWSVSVLEPEPELERTGDHERAGARFPAPGRTDIALPVSRGDSDLDVFIVPFRYTADGSDRLPPLDDARVAMLRDRLYTLFPVQDVNLTVLDVQPTEVEITATDGLSDLLEDLAAWRVQQGVDPQAYVYGLVQPAESREAFCQSGCTIGLSYLVSNPNADGLRASVGVGFDDVVADTLVHELGHAHGRRHAPCGAVQRADPGYPHVGGGIGAPGWDVLSGELLDTGHKDFMGYCTPRWVSAYQLAAIHEQLRAVRSMQRFGSPALEPLWTLAIRPDTPPRLRGIRDGVPQPGGQPWAVEVIDAEGRSLGQVEGQLHVFGHGGGGTLLVPDVGGDALRLPDGTVVWRQEVR